MPKFASCILITTLILVVVANLFLLVFLLVESLKNCENSVKILDKNQTSIKIYRFMSAIISLKDNRKEFICSAAVISKNWLLTTAYCAQIVQNQPLDTVKISCNSTNFKTGILYDIDRIIINEQYDRYKRANNVALINVRRTLKARYVAPITLPNTKFRYLANTTATIVGFDDINNKLYNFYVKLLWHKACTNHYRYDTTINNSSLFCVLSLTRNNDDVASCGYDSSAQLIVKNMLIGIVAFGGCRIDGKPEIFTKTTIIEPWVRNLEKRSNELIEATFIS